MKIRTQNMLAIVPLFLGLAGLIGALMYVVQYRELIWGLDEEATSIAVAAAHHMEAATIRNADADADWKQILKDLLKLLDGERAQRITLLSDDLDVLYDSADGPDTVRPILLSPALQSRMEARSFAATPVQQDERGHYMMAFSPVRDDQGTAAILMVETSAEGLAAHKERMARDIRLIILVTALIGVLLAWLISRIISRRIISLTRAAAAVGAGRYDQPHEVGGVQEINDLSNTFTTMSRVLSEIVARTRRAVVEAEQFRTDDDLARAFTQTFMKPDHRTIHGAAVSGTHVSTRSGNHFFGIWEKGDEVMAVVGELSGHDGLAAPLTASAAAAALRECWLNASLESACAEWSGLFDLAQVELVVWRADAEGMTRGTWYRGAHAFTFTATNWTDRPLVLHTISERVAHRIRLYVETFAAFAPDALTEEIRLTLDRDQQGAVIILKRHQ